MADPQWVPVDCPSHATLNNSASKGQLEVEKSAALEWTVKPGCLPSWSQDEQYSP